MDWLNQNLDDVLLAASLLYGAACIVVRLTPTPKDDEFLKSAIELVSGLGSKGTPLFKLPFTRSRPENK